MFSSNIYEKRRQTLRAKMQSGIILILGNVEAPANYPDNTYKFRQDSSFSLPLLRQGLYAKFHLYLRGIAER